MQSGNRLLRVEYSALSPVDDEDHTMEIVPILSTIILVGTVATFILAVAAYVLYKIREGGAAPDAELAAHQQPHHVVMAVDNQGTMHSVGDSAPAEASTYYAPTGTTPPPGAFVEMNAGYSTPPGAMGGARSLPPGQQPLNTFFWDHSDNGFSPINLQEERKNDKSREE